VHLEIARRTVLVAPRRAELWTDLAHLNKAEAAPSAVCPTLTKSGTAFHNEAALGLQEL